MLEIKLNDVVVLASSDNGALSGSLQRTIDGSPFLTTGVGLSVVTQSNGQLVLSLSDAQSNVLFDEDVIVSSSMGNSFILNAGTLTAHRSASLAPAKLQNTCLSFWLHDLEHFFEIKNGGASPSTLFTSWAYTGECRVDVKYVGSDWQVDCIRQLTPGINLIDDIYPSDCMLDIDPNVSSSYTLDGSEVTSIINLRHETDEFVTILDSGPTLEIDGWSSGTNCLLFNGIDQSLNSVNNSLALALSGTNKPFTLFVVGQYQNSASTERFEAPFSFDQNESWGFEELIPMSLHCDYLGVFHNLSYRRDLYSRVTDGLDFSRHVFSAVASDELLIRTFDEDGEYTLSGETSVLPHENVGLDLKIATLGSAGSAGEMRRACIKIVRVLGFSRRLSSAEHSYVTKQLQIAYLS